MNDAPSSQKRCPRCGAIKPAEDFHKCSKAKDGLSSYCKPCKSRYNNNKWRNDPSYREKVRKANRLLRGEGYFREYHQKNGLKASLRAREQRVADPRAAMWRAARDRAKKKGLFFTIALDEMPPVPEHCPLLGMRLEVAAGCVGPASPTLDRIRAEEGYIPGNVWIISHRANSIKRDATPSELKQIADGVERRLTAEIFKGYNVIPILK